MTITTCSCCGGDYHWQWEDAFDKFGFGDGDGIVMTGVVADTLRKAGYEVDHQAFGIHNTVITSIRKNGADLWVVVTALDVGSFGGFWMLRRVAARLRGNLKVIEFHEDGRIWDSCDGEWKLRVEHIRSIEAIEVKPQRKPEDSIYTHGVRLVTRQGRIARIAQNLEPDDSVTLAVLLNEAIEGVRYVGQGERRQVLNGAEVW